MTRKRPKRPDDGSAPTPPRGGSPHLRHPERRGETDEGMRGMRGMSGIAPQHSRARAPGTVGLCELLSGASGRPRGNRSPQSRSGGRSLHSPGMMSLIPLIPREVKAVILPFPRHPADRSSPLTRRPTRAGPPRATGPARPREADAEPPRHPLRGCRVPSDGDEDMSLRQTGALGPPFVFRSSYRLTAWSSLDP
jgi:hypothetical protein